MCGWHVKNFGRPLEMGEKAPLDSGLVTHGMCDACRDLEYRWVSRTGEPPARARREGGDNGGSPPGPAGT